MNEENKLNRLFVPLSQQPFKWFVNDKKVWELRKAKGQYSPKNVYLNRIVEFRRGYNTEDSLWGKIEDVLEFDSLPEVFSKIPYKKILPKATNAKEAERLAHEILNTNENVVNKFIAFKVSKFYDMIHLADEYYDLIIHNKKKSTIRRGKRNISTLGFIKCNNKILEVSFQYPIYKKFGELTIEDAVADGFKSLDELYRNLEQFYSNIERNEVFTILSFKRRNLYEE